MILFSFASKINRLMLVLKERFIIRNPVVGKTGLMYSITEILTLTISKIIFIK